MTNTPSHVPFHCLITKTIHAISRGDFEASREIFKHTVPGKQQEDVTEFAEALGLMSVKLEAREMQLQETIDELERKNKALNRSLSIRNEFGFLFVSFSFLIGIYTLMIGLMADQDLFMYAVIHDHKEIITHLLGLTMLVGLSSLVFKSTLPLSEFGVTTANWQQSLKESGLATGLVLVFLMILRWWAIHNVPHYMGKPFFDISGVGWAFALYPIVAMIQEFSARGILQGALERLLVGTWKRTKAVLAASVIFGVFHVFYSVELALLSIGASLLWGALYARSRTLIGPILSHFVIGNFLILIGFWDQIA